jgi:hypothetical protein
VDEALSHERIDITVPARTSVSVGPFEAHYSEAFHLAKVTEYADLHRHGFIRQEVAEDRLTRAIRDDDRLFRELVQRQPPGEASCTCEEPKGQVRAPMHRRQVQNHLIDLLQPLHRHSLTAADLLVSHTYGQGKAWLEKSSSHYLVGLVSVNDITIGDGAFLTMTPTVWFLHANEITIGKNAHLVFASGEIHARCKVLNGPSPFSTPALATEKYVKGLSREVRS